METSKNSGNEKQHRLIALKSLVEKGITLGLDLTDVLEKIENVIKSSKDNIIRMVLLGTFSDGKTSVVAGLLGKLEDSMKIDQDESSDELKVYRPNGLKEGFEIVDTPGLFGTKEKEVDGKNIRYSELTQKYISEAHVVIYVCDAVTPLKESHKDIIKLVMRDFNKLESTIFVINKMDEAGTDMLDEEDYNEMSSIKKDNLLKRLRDTIGLTAEEESKMRIACVAADPKGKGLKHWFTDMDGYLKRSHIEVLREYISSITDTLDTDAAKNNAKTAVIKDVLLSMSKRVDAVFGPLSLALRRYDDELKDMNNDLNILKGELNQSKAIMTERLNDLKKSIKMDINNATQNSFGTVIDDDLGMEDKKVTGYILLRKVNQILSECAEKNNATLSMKEIDFNLRFDKQDSMLKDVLKQGGSYLGKVNISGEMVKAARDIFAKSYKFKPWGAVNLGKSMTKLAKVGGGALVLAIEVVSFISAARNEKKLKDLKADIVGEVDKIFKSIFEMFDKDDKYYENFASSYIEMTKRLHARMQEISVMRHKVANLEDYGRTLKDWFKEDAEDADFEEI